MTERKLDAVLYFILAVTALFYLEFTFLNARPVLIMPESELARETDMMVDASSITLELASSERSDINPAGFHIYVDLDVTQMYVYNDGILVKTYEVSGGKPGSSSPEGTWKIINKDTWGEGFGGAWLGFNVPWGMYGIHGTSEPWFLGKTNASKGCIRMKNSDVKELFDMIPYNTTVTIVYKNRPFHPLQDGDVGSSVIEVERALKKLGYYDGSVDGIFGTTLSSAVKEFQKDQGIRRTGVVNISTYELLMKMSSELED